MCLHGKKKIEQAVKRCESDQKFGVVWIEDKYGMPMYGWDCVPLDSQDIANVIRGLQLWHPAALGNGGSVNLSDVNRKRVLLGCCVLSASGLPEPTDTALPSFDNNEAHMEAG
jgi:hypothetical protein